MRYEVHPRQTTETRRYGDALEKNSVPPWFVASEECRYFVVMTKCPRRFRA